MIGGGTKDRFLSELTASACNIRVSSGPVEATALGNIAVQLISSGDIESLERAREIIRDSEKIYTFEPQNPADWDKVYEKYKEVTANA